MLALDLDGTLLGPDGKVSPANRRALEAARAAGMLVTVCTGRGFAECVHVLEAIDQAEPVVVAGGSIIACPRKRGTLHRFPIRRQLVSTSVERVLASGHVALVYKDSSETRYDYLVVRGEAGHELDPVTKWWFEDLRIELGLNQSGSKYGFDFGAEEKRGRGIITSGNHSVIQRFDADVIANEG